MTNALVTALTAGLLYIWLGDLGFSRTTATLTTLGYGLCTIAWIYARMFWESSLLALSFLVAVWAIYRSTRLAYARQRLLWVFLSGLAIALGLTLRFETLPAILFIALFIIWESVAWQFSQWRYTRHTATATETTYQAASGLLRLLLTAIPWGRLIFFTAPVMLAGLGLLYFNLMRYGSLTETGYSREFLFEAPWIGGYGLLFSPGRGLFIYSPLMLLLFFGLRPAWQRLSRPYFWLIAGLCLFYWLFYGAWFAWGGTWGWGPRFLLPILPLLMLFVAEPIEWTKAQWQKEAKKRSHTTGFTIYDLRFTICNLRLTFVSLGILFLVSLSLFVNFLGLAVDFNEHFLRLNRNDNFVFNWADFPPLAHWQILQEGRLDIIWLRPGAEGLTIAWSVLLPALVLCLLAAGGLLRAILTERSALRKQPGSQPRRGLSTGRFATHLTKPSLSSHHVSRFTFYALLALLPLMLVYEMMLGTARLALADAQAQADMPLLKTLSLAAQPEDTLLVPMPPFGDVQEVSTRLLAYLSQPLPTAAWIESPPRAVKPAERAQMWHTTLAEAERVWLFERWLSHDSPLSETAAYFNKAAFPLEAHWFEQSGKLTLYAVADTSTPAAMPLDVPFQGGLTLLDFSLLTPTVPAEERVVKLRLTWQADEASELAAQALSSGSLMASVQLLHPDGSRNIAQNDRRLLDLQNIDQSPILPGQTVQQGYGLRLPEDVPPGSYPLVVSLYRAADGQRLSRADGSPDDFLYLTNVAVD